ncbi:MAG: amidohydrolase family protein [Aquiluna sp.]|nr:amidohydrolase family protein [Aquiluna sp.]
MSARAIANLHLFDGERIISDSWVVIDGVIRDFGQGEGWKKYVGSPEDGSGKFLTPKLIDTHAHGAVGFSNDNGLEHMLKVIDFYKSNGVGKTFLSLISAPIEQMVTIIGVAHEIEDPAFLGLHLEGPFLAEEFKGAHDQQVLHAPTDLELDQIISASKGIVKSMTIAPELFTSQQLEKLKAAGIEPCFGHSAANYSQAKEFFGSVGKIMTHAFNAMQSIHHRAAGPIPAALEAAAFTELIADGEHVHPEAARLLNPEKVILVTDSMAATGMPDGDYKLGSMDVRVVDSVARTHGGSIAGSTLLLTKAVQNYAGWISDPAAAFKAATTNPAIAYGLDEPKLDAGSNSWLLWDTELNLEEQGS